MMCIDLERLEDIDNLESINNLENPEYYIISYVNSNLDSLLEDPNICNSINPKNNSFSRVLSKYNMNSNISRENQVYSLSMLFYLNFLLFTKIA